MSKTHHVTNKAVAPSTRNVSRIRLLKVQKQNLRKSYSWWNRLSDPQPEYFIDLYSAFSQDQLKMERIALQSRLNTASTVFQLNTLSITLLAGVLGYFISYLTSGSYLTDTQNAFMQAMVVLAQKKPKLLTGAVQLINHISASKFALIWHVILTVILFVGAAIVWLTLKIEANHRHQRRLLAVEHLLGL